MARSFKKFGTADPKTHVTEPHGAGGGGPRRRATGNRPAPRGSRPRDADVRRVVARDEVDSTGHTTGTWNLTDPLPGQDGGILNDMVVVAAAADDSRSPAVRRLVPKEGTASADRT